MTDHTTHDLAIARAERDAWQSTCDELHRAIAGAIVEIEAHLGRCEAADQRARSLDAALTAEREAGRGLVAQVEQLRGDLQWARSRVKCAGNVEDPCGWRGLGAAVLEWEDSGETPRCPNCDEGCVEIDHAAEAHPECVGNDVAELAAIRDLVAPGNPQGTVVDAVRAMATGLIESIGARDAAEQARDMARDSRDAAIARTEKAEADLRSMSRARDSAIKAIHEYDAAWVKIKDDRDGWRRAAGTANDELSKLRAEVAELTVTRDRLLAREHEDGRLHAQLRAELAELRARPVLTEDLLRGALDAHGHAALTRKLFAHLGPVTLPSPDRAEEHKELTALAKLSPDPAPTFDAAFLRRVMVATKHGPNGKGGPGPCDAACVKCEAERMVKAAPAREVAPTLVAVSDEELAVAFYSEPERPALRECIDAADLAGIRAVRAKLGAAEVTEERLAAALAISIPPANGQRAKTCLELASDAIAYLRATAAKGG